MPAVSIIIVNYNTLAMTRACIESVRKLTEDLDYEIILVDNASTDGSREFFSADTGLKYIYNDENLGFGRANNRGLEQACGRNVLFLNSDTLLWGNAVKILSDYLDSHKRVGACGGNLFTRSGGPNQSYMPFRPGIISELARFFEIKPKGFNRLGFPIRVGFVSGADLMVKKEVLDRVGAFDERFFLYFEETELCSRIAGAGYSIMSVPKAEITHFGGATVRKEDKEKVYFESRRLYYELTHGKRTTAVADAIWAATVYTRIAFNCFRPQARQKWIERRKML